MPLRFSWVIEARVAGMERPGSFSDFEEDLRFLREKGIDVIINLEEEEHVREYHGFHVKHIPIDDFTAPSLQDFEEFVEYVRSKISEGKRIAVHCFAGMGRTNVMIASYLIHHFGVDAISALDLVRERRPVHFVNEEQMEALLEYYYSTRLTEKKS